MARFFIGIIFFLVFTEGVASGLVLLKTRGVYLYHTPETKETALRFKEQLPGMTNFLSSMGLELSPGIHVVLDDELDFPAAGVRMTPHREIRIPVKAPGVLENGFTEKDPWSYFLFRGLCLQAIYEMRSGIPGALHKVFGEIISPNVLMPQWMEEGILDLLWKKYCDDAGAMPLDKAILTTSRPPAMDRMSNHPGIWPGHFAYRIHGRPFISWVEQTRGWGRILEFLEVHGKGVVPIEIDLKALKVFGKTWPEMFAEYEETKIFPPGNNHGRLIHGFTEDPFIYWNHAGIFPGLKKARIRSRYGCIDPESRLLLSEYDSDGISRITGYRKGVALSLDKKHVWDPGTGNVAVSRSGMHPEIVFIENRKRTIFVNGKRSVPAPGGAISVSGPVMNAQGRIAAAINMSGNWDIWVFDGEWNRMTSSVSIEMDPFWHGDTLVFVSNISGRFEVYGPGMEKLSDASHAAVLPRQESFLSLGTNGWKTIEYEVSGTAGGLPPEETREPEEDFPDAENGEYSPFPSLFPDYIRPDLYAGGSDVQAGLATEGEDVSGKFRAGAAFRYSFDDDYFSGIADGKADIYALQASRYSISYDPENAPETAEHRYEVKAAIVPFDPEWLEIYINRMSFRPSTVPGERDKELRGGVGLSRSVEDLGAWLNIEKFSGGMRSVFGGVSVVFGENIYGGARLQAGISRGGKGHGTFRIGGDIEEGYFTKRPSRLFPLRGFSSNILEGDTAITSGVEVYWPLANIQKGYETLPLFFHRLVLGTFVDVGACADHVSRSDILAGAGIELVTSMEIAWGNLSSFRIGLAWPVTQPGYLDEDGPVFIVQIGKPL